MPRRFLTAVLSVLVCFGVLYSVSAQSGAPCDNVEVQLWWTKTGTQTNHVHMGGCWPIYRTAGGQVQFDTQFKLHLATGLLYQYRNANNVVITAGQAGPPSNGWPGLKGDGQFLLDTVDSRGNPMLIKQTVNATTAMKQVEGRFKDVDGTPMRLVRMRFSFDRSYASVDGLGWFQGGRYTNVMIKQAHYLAAQAGVKGTWTPQVKFNSSASGTSAQATRDGFVSVDPDVHHGNFGVVQFNTKQLGPGVWNPIAIDTTKFPNGWHKLMMKASDAGRFANGTLETVLVIPFLVAN